ncbi:Strictosidine synthase 1 [Morus notabilis]|uniref:Strictosidine synthase 1 n=1 Tax=Morus notabilis TaxID=981085 RepID=W9RH32_9ROSA|nr:protein STRICTOSIDINE SYNTHASE-LIKE 12 [Morus notabilis]EXB76384.1 Strictosidine synthase 1 [Morus notabilis]
MLSVIVLILSFSFPSNILPLPISSFRRLDLPLTSVGPEAITFDRFGGGPYTGISDGRVVKHNGSTFIEIFITSPNRTSLECDGTNNPATLGVTCGRPFGVGFYFRENQLFIADAYRGLLVGVLGKKLAVPIATGAEGVPFKFPNALDVDQLTGDVYFTDASARFSLSQIQEAVATNDSTGRLLKYDRRTQQVTVLLKNLSGAAGVAINANRTFVLVSEFIANRITKFWLRGPNAFKSQVVATFQGMPDNIKRTPSGDFWVAVNVPGPGGVMLPTAIRINGNGNILKTLHLEKYYKNTPISEFQQRGFGTYYIGSRVGNFVGVIN